MLRAVLFLTLFVGIAGTGLRARIQDTVAVANIFDDFTHWIEQNGVPTIVGAVGGPGVIAEQQLHSVENQQKVQSAASKIYSGTTTWSEDSDTCDAMKIGLADFYHSCTKNQPPGDLTVQETQQYRNTVKSLKAGLSTCRAYTEKEKNNPANMVLNTLGTDTGFSEATTSMSTLENYLTNEISKEEGTDTLCGKAYQKAQIQNMNTYENMQTFFTEVQILLQ